MALLFVGLGDDVDAEALKRRADAVDVLRAEIARRLEAKEKTK